MGDGKGKDRGETHSEWAREKCREGLSYGASQSNLLKRIPKVKLSHLNAYL